MPFSYSAVWNDTVALLKRHGGLIGAVAGVFIFLPLLLTGYLLPTPASETDPFGALSVYYGEVWPWLLLSSVVNALGAIAIYRLIFTGPNVTVGQAIGGAAALLPFYFLLSIISSFAIGVGFLLFIVPGIYLIGRLLVSGPAMVAENRRNPLDALGESWRLTAGKGWAVAGLIIVVALAGFIAAFVATAIPGTIVVLAAGRDGIGQLLLALLTAAANTGLYMVLIVLLAAIYRALRGESGVSLDKGT